MWAARTTRQDLERILWLFDDQRPRKSHGYRTETRYNPDHYNESRDLDQPKLYDADGCRRVSFGRYHRFVRTTNGATIDIEISCPVLRQLSKKDTVYLQCFKGNGHKHYHFTATPYRGQEAPESFEMVRFNNSILLQFGQGRFQKQFRIWKCDIATGSGRSSDSPQSILWSEADRYRFDRVVEFSDVQGRNLGLTHYRLEFLANLATLKRNNQE